MTLEHQSFQLVVGLTASSVESTQMLLDDLFKISSTTELAAVLVCDNSHDPTFIRLYLERFERQGTRVRLVTGDEIVDAAKKGRLGEYYAEENRQKGIAFGRTALHYFLYLESHGFGNPVVWILDDDVRLEQPYFSASSAEIGGLSSFEDMLGKLKSESVDIAIGRIAGDPPIPAASMIRTQLLDLDFNLRALCNPDTVVDRIAVENQNNNNIRKYPDFYYDLTSRHGGHLETPWWFLGEHDSSDRLKLLEEMLAKVKQILKGVNIFRSLPSVLPAVHAEGPETPTRGGNTFVFNIDCLIDFPNISPNINGLPLRRGDTLWTILNRYTASKAGNRRVVRINLPVRQDRQFNKNTSSQLQVLLSDILGSAFTKAVEETLGKRFAGTDGPLTCTDACKLTSIEVSEIVTAFSQRVKERIAQLQLNSWRIRGLVDSITAQIKRTLQNGGPESILLQRHIASIEELLQAAEKMFSESQIEGLKHAAESCDPDELESFLQNLHLYCRSYRENIPASDKPDEIQHAISILRKHFGDKEFHFLAKGSEGMVLTDGTLAYKFFYRGIDNFQEDQLQFISEKLSRQMMKDKKHILPLEGLVNDGKNVVFVTKLVQGHSYKGGFLNQILELVSEARSTGIAIMNISPENLIATDDSLAYIDLGRSIMPVSERGYREMCKRAFLVYKWHFRKDLKEILRQALHDDSIPELFGFHHFLSALETKDVHEGMDDVLVSLLTQEKPQNVLDYGCGNGIIAERLAKTGILVTAYDIDSSKYEKHEHSANITFIDRPQLQRLLTSCSKFDGIVCSMVLCTIDSQDKVKQILSEMRNLVDNDGKVLLALCNPFDLENKESETHIKNYDSTFSYSGHFQYSKFIKLTHRCRTEFHRPLSWYSLMLKRAGFEIQKVTEILGTDIADLCPGSDTVVLSLKPISIPGPSNISLLIKASAMEWRSIGKQVIHLVRQLEYPRLFLEKVVVVDTNQDRFARQYDTGYFNLLKAELVSLADQGIIDRVVVTPEDDGTLSTLARKWFGLKLAASRCQNGQPTLTTLYGFEQCKGDYILHVDSDCLIGRMDRGHDYLKEMLDVFNNDQNAITVSFPIAGGSPTEYTTRNSDGKWRTEVRCGMISKSRLENILPLPNAVINGSHLDLPWHRALDVKLNQLNYESYRGGDPKTFFIHVPNERKRDFNSWYNIMKAVEEGRLYQGQLGHVDLVGGIADWLETRSEDLILVVRGRNVSMSKLRRCFDSLTRQSNLDWALLVIDAGSDNGMDEYIDNIFQAKYGSKMTFYRNLVPEAPIANIYSAIHHLCDNNNSIIIMVDADDAFINTNAIDYVKSVYHAKDADLAIGGLLRTDKDAKYPVNFDDPRQNRGGNVWQPLRTFRKYLFDKINVEDLKVEGEWVPHTEDWALMVPMAELSKSPAYLDQIIYLYEPSTLKQTLSKEEREQLIGKIVSKPSYRRA